MEQMGRIRVHSSSAIYFINSKDVLGAFALVYTKMNPYPRPSNLENALEYLNDLLVREFSPAEHTFMFSTSYEHLRIFLGNVINPKGDHKHEIFRKMESDYYINLDTMIDNTVNLVSILPEVSLK